jgi:hypothetical protein
MDEKRTMRTFMRKLTSLTASESCNELVIAAATFILLGAVMRVARVVWAL